MSLRSHPRAAASVSTPLALVAIVAGNLVPLVGVLFFGWDLLTLLVVFWLESGVVGALNVPKMLLAGAPGEANLTINGRPVEVHGPDTPPDRPTLHLAYLPLAGFFVLHYGIFWVVHGVFVLSFGAFVPSPGLDPFALPPLGAVLLGAGAAAIGHGVSFVTNYLGDEYRTATASGQMMAPYGRVVALHLTILVGAMLAATFGAPALALAVLVLVKTVGDVAAHLREHAKATRRAAEREGEDEDDAGTGTVAGDAAQ